MIYQWRAGSRVPKGLNATDVGARLTRIGRDAGGLTAEAVVDDARPPESLLHPAFEWDDSLAAEQYRCEQARRLIRAVVVHEVSSQQDQPVRAFVLVREPGAEDDAYVPTQVALAREDLREQVLRRALRELEQFERKYRELSELSELIQQMTVTRKRVRRSREPVAAD